MNSRKKIGTFRFGDPGQLAPGVMQLSEYTTLNKFLEELEGESDRSVVLVASAFFDEALLLRLKKHLGRGNSRILDSLFDLSGPLSSFSSKIDLLFCLGDISKDIRDDLHVIRKVRNYCAHHWDSFQLDAAVEAKYFSRMNTKVKLHAANSKEKLIDTDALPPRSKFITICGFISLFLNLFIDKENTSSSTT
jgi:DNA-binding MltR family transcriptional regulator